MKKPRRKYNSCQHTSSITQETREQVRTLIANWLKTPLNNESSVSGIRDLLHKHMDAQKCYPHCEALALPWGQSAIKL